MVMCCLGFWYRDSLVHNDHMARYGLWPDELYMSMQIRFYTEDTEPIKGVWYSKAWKMAHFLILYLCNRKSELY